MTSLRCLREGKKVVPRAGGEGGVAWEDAWEEPGPRFRAWVQECVLRTLGRHCQASAPDALKREEAVWAFRKAVRVVVDNEQKVRATLNPKLRQENPPSLRLATRLHTAAQVVLRPVQCGTAHAWSGCMLVSCRAHFVFHITLYQIPIRPAIGTRVHGIRRSACAAWGQAYAERQRARAPKPIDRRKLEPRIADYIRDTVKVLIEKRDTG